MCEIRCWVTSGLQLLWPLKKILNVIFFSPVLHSFKSVVFPILQFMLHFFTRYPILKIELEKKRTRIQSLSWLLFLCVGRKQKESPTRGSSQLVSFICTCIYSLCSIKSWDWMRGWLLFNANLLIFQLYHHKNKLIFNEMIMRSALY